MKPASTATVAGIQDLDDVPPHVTGEIGHFFDIYKELERGKAPTYAAGRTARLP
jgi:inorganic pyrophosphatase